MNPQTFNFQPTLKNEFITLRPLQSEDFEPLFESASDPLIWVQHPQPDRYKKDIFHIFFESAIKSGGALIAIENQTQEVLGSSRYYDLHLEKAQVVIGYTFLRRKYWGGLYNKELKRLMLEHAFESLDTVYFHIGINNLRSQKAIEKIGAQPLEKQNFDGHSHVIYKINKKRFSELFDLRSAGSNPNLCDQKIHA